jgi:hypothetical protein
MSVVSRKGILESIPDFFQIVVALAIGIILIAITFRFFALQNQGNITVSGNTDEASQRIANYILDCWKNHRQGLDSQSAVCSNIRLNTNVLITEKNVTKFLDCETLPNDACLPDDCSSCISSRYPEGSQDRLTWNFDNSTNYMEISYLGFDRAVKVSNTFPSE